MNFPIPVAFEDDSAVFPCSDLSLPCLHACLSALLVRHFLVLLQLPIVQEGLATQVAHERLGGAVEQHVSLQLILDEAGAAHAALERSLARMDAGMPLEVLLQREAGTACFAGERLTLRNLVLKKNTNKQKSH